MLSALHGATLVHFLSGVLSGEPSHHRPTEPEATSRELARLPSLTIPDRARSRLCKPEVTGSIPVRSIARKGLGREGSAGAALARPLGSVA
jgi:hypothetical protein